MRSAITTSRGWPIRPTKCRALLRDLGHRHTLIMYNHGLLSVGASVGEAFGWMRTLIDECRLVERALATGRKIRTIPNDVQIHTKAQMGGNNRGNSPRDDHSWQYWLRLGRTTGPGICVLSGRRTTAHARRHRRWPSAFVCCDLGGARRQCRRLRTFCNRCGRRRSNSAFRARRSTPRSAASNRISRCRIW